MLLLTVLIRHLAELLSLHRGQGLDLLWRDSLQCPTEEEYIGMVNNSEHSIPSAQAIVQPRSHYRDRWSIADRYQIDDGYGYHQY